MNGSGWFGSTTYSGGHNETPEAKVQRLERELGYMRKEVERVQSQPGALRVVTAISGTRATVASPMAPIEIEVPKNVAETLRAGMTVRVRVDNGTFLALSDVQLAGPVQMVSRAAEPGWCEVAMQDGSRRVPCAFEVKPGDRVQLDPSGAVVTANLGPASTHAAPAADVFGWDQIVGLDDAKRALRAAIEDPVRHPEVFSKFGKRPVRGVLLSGPPGNGKSLLARAAATALRTLHGGKGASGFIYVKGPELLGSLVGQSERNIRDLFVRARAHHRDHGFPAILFIDEADAVLGKRGMGRSSDMERTIVPQFLAELDGLDEASCLVLLATNRPGILDPAVVRPGRVDRIIHVARPSKADVERIIAMGLEGKPVEHGPDYDAATLASIASGMLYDERRIVQTIQTTAGAVDVPLSVIVSGAIAASVVERTLDNATQRAVRGERALITTHDVASAVKSIEAEMKHIDLGDDVNEWVVARAKERAVAATAAQGMRAIEGAR